MRSVRRIGGHTGYLLVVIKKIFSFREFSFNIHYDGNTTEKKFLVLMINNNTRTGGGFMVTPLAKIDDGKLDLLLCDPLPVLKRFFALPLLEKGKHLGKSFIRSLTVEEITIKASREVFAALDGELISGDEYVIKVLPGKFLFRY
jgi:diacylglycerol kinase family enzyme